MKVKKRDFLDASTDDEEEERGKVKDDSEFQINEDYAAKYDTWRQKEEFEKLKARYGDYPLNGLQSSDSSSSDTEDENIESKPIFEKNFFKTLSCLMSDDPKIYDKTTTFFTASDENDTQDSKKKTKKEKPIYLKDYERKIVLEKGGHFSDDEESETEAKKVAPGPSYVQEQKEIIESFKNALEDSDDDNILQEKQKTKEEKEKEDEDYVLWLKGKKKELNEEAEKDMKYLRDYWSNPKLDSSEAFLRDYILNKRYLEQEDKNRIAAYDEIAHDSEDLSEDEKTLQKQAEFERKFNFRFEEPDTEFIKHYPRTMSDSYRKKNTQRKDKREERKVRKLEEKDKKKEELKRLKALKRQEILDKLERLKEITGNTNVGFDDDDIEGEFDPEAHDRKMQKIFNDDYYEVEENAGKPEFYDDAYDDYETEDWDTWTRSNVNNGENENEDDFPHCEDPDFIMDADYNPEQKFQDEMVEASKTKKRRRKSRFAEIMSKAKPLFNPDDETYENYLDEYYKLDYEDLIGDLPCRFKYRKVVPNDFGLTVDEILGAEDKELNKWSSLKKAYQYRTKDKEQYEVQAYRIKAKNQEKKKRILSSLYQENEEEESITKQKKRESKQTVEEETIEKEAKSENANDKSERKGQDDVTTWKSDETIRKNEISEETGKSKKSKKKKKRKNIGSSEGFDSSTQVTNQNISNDQKSTSEKHQNCPSVNSKNISNKARKREKYKKWQQRTDKKQGTENKQISDERLRAYGLNPKKFKSNHKKFKT